MDLIKHYQWRYATKQFDPEKKLSEKALSFIKQAIQLSASSYGLQLYKVLQIDDISIRQQLKAASYGQPQVTDASNLFVFCRYAEVVPAHIDEYMLLKAACQKVSIESTALYGEQIKKNVIDNLSKEKQDIWTAKQVYIALSNALSACAVQQIDAAPMEGFDPEAYDAILDLHKKGLKSTVILAVGYRSADDATQFLAKVRKPLEMLFETI